MNNTVRLSPLGREERVTKMHHWVGSPQYDLPVPDPRWLWVYWPELNCAPGDGPIRPRLWMEPRVHLEFDLPRV